MKNFKKILKPLVAGLAIMAGGLLSGNVYALTASGTSITNTSTVSYTVGGVSQTAVLSSAATFVVDTLVSMTLTPQASYTTVVPNATLQVTKFTYANTGNSTMNSILTPAALATGTSVYSKTSNFLPTACAAYQDGNSNGTFESASDTKNYVENLAAGSSISLFVVCTIPSAQSNNDFGAVNLIAQASAATTGAAGTALVASSGAKVLGTVATVFGDAAGTDDVANDGKISARSGYLVQTSTLTANKTVVTWCDPVNGATNSKLFPGAYAQYTISVANSATATASAILGNIGDTLVAQLAFDPNLVQATTGCATPTSASGKGVKVSCVGGSRACVTTPIYLTTTGVVSGQVLTVNLGTVLPAEGSYALGELKPGETVNVIFNAVVQ
jgi:hypothetical protein